MESRRVALFTVMYNWVRWFTTMNSQEGGGGTCVKRSRMLVGKWELNSKRTQYGCGSSIIWILQGTTGKHPDGLFFRFRFPFLQLGH